MTGRAEDMQLEALRAFLFLQSLRADWGGALAISCGLNSAGAAFTIAANMAGAGSLAMEANGNLARAALRAGASDFVVNSVDEALRILKNEIRKRKPVSVGLAMDEIAALEQLTARGVAPEVFTAFGSPDPGKPGEYRTAAAEVFRSTGATIADFDGEFVRSERLAVQPRLLQWLETHGLSLESLTFATADELRACDLALAQTIPATDARHRWCVGAPRFFHRERPYRRVVALTPEERARVTL